MLKALALCSAITPDRAQEAMMGAGSDPGWPRTCVRPTRCTFASYPRIVSSLVFGGEALECT